LQRGEGGGWLASEVETGGLIAEKRLSCTKKGGWRVFRIENDLVQNTKFDAAW
jgi:hypothetical protein